MSIASPKILGKLRGVHPRWSGGMLAVLPLLLTACSPASDAPGAASPSEERALDDAAASLDANAADSNMADISNDTQITDQPE